jgi:hypothetical protein
MTTHSHAWLESAKSDLEVIREIIENNELTNMVAFHAEHAIEKAFNTIHEEKEDAGLLPSGKPSTEEAESMRQFVENIYKQVKKYLE